MKQTFEDFLMTQHAQQYVGTKHTMVDDFGEWLSSLSPDEIIEYGDLFAKKQSKGLVSIGVMVDRENNTYKTAHDLGFKEGYKKGLVDGKIEGIEKAREIIKGVEDE